MNKVQSLVLIAFSLGMLSGCNDEEVRVQAQKALDQNHIALKLDHGLKAEQSAMITKDLIDFKNLKEIYQFAQKTAFALAFGDYKTESVIKFITERVHYLTPPLPEADREQMKRVNPVNFKYEDWGKDPELKKKMKSAGAQTMASNLGTAIFMMGAINDVPVKMKLLDQWIPVASPRAGIMQVGDLYAREIHGGPFGIITVKIPAGLRLDGLVHEGRHSDCAKAWTASDVEAARTSRSLPEFAQKFQKDTCGYSHAYCPKGHQFAGIPACDDMVWGAYAFGAVFADTVQEEYLFGKMEKNSGTQGWLMMAETATDSYSRLLYSAEDLKKGKLGKPNLESVEPAVIRN